MKYLKKIFESNLMLDTNILGDILQEITDLGYRSHVDSSWWSDDRGNSIRITIYGKSEYDKQFNCEVDYIYPDDVMEVVERLVDFLGSEGYKLYEKDKKEIEVIKNRPVYPVTTGIDKTIKKEIKVTTSRTSQVTMRWDDKIEGYKVCYSLSIEFKQ
jgi:hypothetical protein